MTDTRDSFVNVKPVIVADTPDAHQVWLDIGVQHFTVGEYCETKEDAEWHAAQLRIALTALQAGAGDGDRMDFLESLAVADIDEKAITRLAIFNLWRGTTYDNLRAAIDAAILAEKGSV